MKSEYAELKKLKELMTQIKAIDKIIKDIDKTSKEIKDVAKDVKDLQKSVDDVIEEMGKQNVEIIIMQGKLDNILAEVQP